MKLTQIRPNLFHINYTKQVQLTKAFLRVQEYYESPEFKDKIFTLGQYREWYKKDHDGVFSYYTDWSGFNVPSEAFTPFFDGMFDPLDSDEKRLFKNFKKLHDSGKKFYVIGTYGNEQRFLDHEIAHGMYYLNSEYKKTMDEALEHIDLRSLTQWLTDIGYNESVHMDECQAYLATYSMEWFKNKEIVVNQHTIDVMHDIFELFGGKK